jgi:hypothetical protein
MNWSMADCVGGTSMAERFLIKLRDSTPLGFGSFRPTLGGANFKLTPLSQSTSGASIGFGAAPAGANWYVAEPTDQMSLDAARSDLGGRNDWDAAREFVGGAFAGHAQDVLAFEPDIVQKWLPHANLAEGEPLAAAGRCSDAEKFDREFASGTVADWHLGPDFTGLRAAREAVGDKARSVVIAHLDTGFDPDHVTCPVNLEREPKPGRRRNFWDDDPRKRQDARDPGADGLFNNPGHGPGTLGILAGDRLTGQVQPPDARTNDFLGGAHLATVIPMRIANSVVHFSTSSVAAALNAAREEGVDVVSMSMGGLPSQAWADAVNHAYESGVTIVCAAGNTFGNPPTSIVYPARFNRVIAACGVMADGKAYDELPLFVMHGCAGPLSKMNTALSAYTPNIPWARLGCPNIVDLNGAGTSSATPQIAAAAALWIARHDKPFPGSWQRVEAVRRALFHTARRARPNDVDAHLGWGILSAAAALAQKPANPNDLRAEAPDNAELAFFKLLLGMGIAATPHRPQQNIGLEFAQLFFRSKVAETIIPDPDNPPAVIPDSTRQKLVESILDTKLASQELTDVLLQSIGRISPVARRLAETVEDLETDRGDHSPLIQGESVRPRPRQRRLAIYATDPGASNQLRTMKISKTVIGVPWEANQSSDNLLQPGPVGEYIEVVDVDHASNRIYKPVDLNDPATLASDGLEPSTGNPQFHQQMVYAVAMRTIANFERALGRPVLWATKRIRPPAVADEEHLPYRRPRIEEHYVGRLRIYPHGLRQRNAYYSPDKVALLFGYFPDARYRAVKGASPVVFTCLSHDTVAHETCHAILDGLHRRYQYATNPDVHAFHEGFADIVAIFQHFTFTDMLIAELQTGRGNLRESALLVSLAQEFGLASGYGTALRSALGNPDMTLANTTEPHERGAILVAAVFDAFRSVFDQQVADLLRLASGGTGNLPLGSLPTDLVNRLALEAVRTAGDILTMCIRALDYCPPVDITFGEYLRALITADSDVVGDDRRGYRVALLEAFAARGIYPRGLRSMSVESLRWRAPEWQPAGFAEFLRTLDLKWQLGCDRREAYSNSKRCAAALHKWLSQVLHEKNAHHFGLDFTQRDADGRPRFEVHSVRPASRILDDGKVRNELIIVITQKKKIPNQLLPSMTIEMRGGATLIVDIDNDAAPIRYAVLKNINSEFGIQSRQAFAANRSSSAYDLYFGGQSDWATEPFALIHSTCGDCE